MSKRNEKTSVKSWHSLLIPETVYLALLGLIIDMNRLKSS